MEDHCKGIKLALEKGEIGESYLFGGNCEKNNIEVVNIICEQMDKIKPRKNGSFYKDLIRFVKDRAGHDFRYAISNDKSEKELGFRTPHEVFFGVEVLYTKQPLAVALRI